MKKIVESMKKRPINVVLMGLVICAYWINNSFFKAHSDGIIQMFLICYFNDLICPLFFFSYANLLLLTVKKEIRKLWVVILISICTSFVWEFVTPLIKPSSTTDLVDILCYVTGGILYWTILHFEKQEANTGETSKYYKRK